MLSLKLDLDSWHKLKCSQGRTGFEGICSDVGTRGGAAYPTFESVCVLGDTMVSYSPFRAKFCWKNINVQLSWVTQTHTESIRKISPTPSLSLLCLSEQSPPPFFLNFLLLISHYADAPFWLFSRVIITFTYLFISHINNLNLRLPCISWLNWLDRHKWLWQHFPE